MCFRYSFIVSFSDLFGFSLFIRPPLSLSSLYRFLILHKATKTKIWSIEIVVCCLFCCPHFCFGFENCCVWFCPVCCCVVCVSMSGLDFISIDSRRLELFSSPDLIRSASLRRSLFASSHFLKNLTLRLCVCLAVPDPERRIETNSSFYY